MSLELLSVMQLPHLSERYGHLYFATGCRIHILCNGQYFIFTGASDENPALSNQCLAYKVVLVAVHELSAERRS